MQPTEESPPCRARPRPACGGRIRFNFNTKGILGRRKCITRKGDRRRGDGDTSLPSYTPALPEPRAAVTKPSGSPLRLKSRENSNEDPHPPSSSEGRVLSPPATPELPGCKDASCPSPRLTHLFASLLPPFLPGAPAPGLTFVFLPQALNFSTTSPAPPGFSVESRFRVSSSEDGAAP